MRVFLLLVVVLGVISLTEGGKGAEVKLKGNAPSRSRSTRAVSRRGTSQSYRVSQETENEQELRTTHGSQRHA